jgi:hypothetical protein
MLTRGTFRRPADMTNSADPAVLYVKSYLLIRTLVGVIGILLPVILLAGEAVFLNDDIAARHSLSAYYHTSMRDVFVAALAVIGFLLATYMAAQPRTWDFWLSLLAGVAVLGVVFFPTGRPGLGPDAPRCGSIPAPEGCVPIQQRLGEELVAGIHYAFAAVFILCLAAIAFLFAYRARQYERNRTMAAFQDVCGWVILAAALGAVVGELSGTRLWGLTPLYVGEVVAVWAFGASWLMKGTNLRSALRLRRSQKLHG